MKKQVKQLLSRVSFRHIANAMRRMIPTLREAQAFGDCFKHPCKMPTCLWQWWRDLSLACRRFLVNLIVGLVVALLLHTFHHSPALREVEDASMDWVVRMRKGIVPNEPTLPFGWIDIDDNTYMNWKEPLYIPREKLAMLIRYTLQARPEMVVVDVDLAQRGHCGNINQPIISVLAEHADKCRNKPLASEGCPPVALLASLRPPSSEKGYPIQRISSLDNLVNNSQHIFWASPLFDKDWDQSIRRWRIWEAVWNEADNRPAALPSIQLLTATLLTGRKGAMEELQSCLDSAVLEGCKTTINHPVSGDKLPKPCETTLWEAFEQRTKLKLNLSWDRVSRRILYVIPWQMNAQATSGSTIPIVRTTRDQDRKRLLLLRISALNICDRKGIPGNCDLEGRVVFIGGSFSDGRDIHPSPLGEMPGVLILINALHSLLQYDEIEEVSLPVKILVEVLLITLLSVIFSVWKSFWGMIISNLSIVVVLVPVSICLFGYGLWLDFALPLVAVQIHQIAADFEEGRAARHVIDNFRSPTGDGSLDS